MAGKGGQGGAGDAEQAGFAVGPLAATVVLTAVAGYVDAFAYVHLFETFPANQSGNIALLGIAIGQGQVGDVALLAIAVLGFALGMAAGVALDDRSRRDAPHRARLVLAIELVVLAAVAVVVTALGAGDEPLQGWWAPALLAPTAFAMGIQTPAIVRTHGVPTPTTYVTGSVAHLAEALAEAGTRRRTAPDDAGRARRRSALLGVVLVGYIAGAALGALVGRFWAGALIAPVAVLALLLALRRR